MERAVFSLTGFKFDKAVLSMESVTDNTGFAIKFTPSGEYIKSDRKYNLKFIFEASDSVSGKSVVLVSCLAEFLFSGEDVDIPDYFYNNAIAILYPYIRSFVSTVTLQANIKPIVLPVLNLSSLQTDLKNNTETK